MEKKIETFEKFENKLFLCFWVGDGGDRESNSVYYSKLIEAPNKTEAIKKMVNLPGGFMEKDPKFYDAIKMDILK